MKGSLARRAFGAVAMLVGFYVLALVAVVGALAVAIVPWTMGVHLIWLTLGCLATAATIAWSIFPRRMPFVAPGPELTREAQPELHALVDEVADATGQERPAVVYLAHDVNAAVTQAGGFAGFGGRRVLIVGLPLLHCLTIPQLRAVIAHEFGHYSGGDVRLLTFFRRTHDAVARTVTALAEDDSWLHKPFHAYGMFFLRSSSSTSRAQEYEADRLAAVVAGRGAAISTLKAVEAQATAFGAYWDTEYAPLLQNGVRAPFVGGWTRFAGVPKVREMMSSSVEEALTARADRYASHPELGERLAALEALPDAQPLIPASDARPAICLLRDEGEVERAVIDSILVPDARGRMRSLDWDDVPAQVLEPQWRKRLTELSSHMLSRLTLAGVVEASGRARTIAEEAITLHDRQHIPPATIVTIGREMLGTALAVALVDAGGTISADPGEPVRIALGGETFEPFGLPHRVADGEEGVAESFQRQLEALGIAERPLLGAAPASQPVAA